MDKTREYVAELREAIHREAAEAIELFRENSEMLNDADRWERMTPDERAEVRANVAALARKVRELAGLIGDEMEKYN